MPIKSGIDWKAAACALLSAVMSLAGFWLIHVRHLPTRDEVSKMIESESKRELILSNQQHTAKELDKVVDTLEKANTTLNSLNLQVARISQKIDDMEPLRNGKTATTAKP